MVLATWLFSLASAIVALAWARHFYREMIAADEGDDRMREIAQNVRDGANAYLRQQNFWVAIVFVAVAALLAVAAMGAGLIHPLTPLAFLLGGLFSGLCGWFGMKTATAASGRTAAAARESLGDGLRIAFRSGAVMGLTVVGMGLLFICLWWAVLYWGLPSFGSPMTVSEITVTMLSFGMGASAQALFARVGGGIFTKAADVGADLVGKVEKSLSEDSPYNPATIADNVGDNVGDVAGMGADLYESYTGSILAAAALGVAAVAGGELLDASEDVASATLAAVMLPVAISAVGILLSIAGVYAVRTDAELSSSSLLKALSRGINLSAAMVAVAAIVVCTVMMPTIPVATYFGFVPGVAFSVIIGLVAGWAIGLWTERVTSDEYKPTQRLAEKAETGPATVIIVGVADGMLSTWVPVLIVCVAMFGAFNFANGFGYGDADRFALGLYGVGLAAVGMLSTLGITLATDAYGPIADNAGGNAEMSGLEDVVRSRTDALDSLGNTTAATGKGFAIGSAALTALALLAAYIESVRDSFLRWGRDLAARGEQFAASESLALVGDGEAATVALQMPDGSMRNVADASLQDFLIYFDATLMNPSVLIGLFLGAMASFVFCALTMRSVGKAAEEMVIEVRRQFLEKPGILDGSDPPDYERPVALSTQAAQREMILPALLGLGLPVGVGLLFGVAGVLGLLAGSLTSGFCLAVFMANSGGAWDNAKKYIEADHFGGKGSDAHKAAVVGDTVGDPFKDTSGPSLNILIKLMSMVSVVVAGLIVRYG